MAYEEVKGDRISRVLSIYTKLLDGEVVNKAIEARKHGVNERTIQRDIDDILNFFDEDVERAGFLNSIVYDRIEKGYRIEQINRMKLSNNEILALCKIVLDSRAFTKREMTDMLDRLVSCCSPKAEAKMVRELISNEEFHYIELRHKSEYLGKMWEIGIAIRNCCYIEMDYYRTRDKSVFNRKVKPVAIMFSEYYFYLTAFIDEDDDVREHFDVSAEIFGEGINMWLRSQGKCIELL